MSLLSISSFTAIAITSLSLSLFGSTLDWRNAQINNGAVYAGNSNKPFTGKVTNVPYNSVFSYASKYMAGYFQQLQVYTNATGQTPGGLICDVDNEDGMLDGTATCMAPNSTIKVLEAKFDGGRLDGSFKYYSYDGKTLLNSVSFKEGLPDGEQKMYSQRTGHLLHVVNWDNGVLDGKEEAFDLNTGNKILSVSYTHGKIDGEFTKWASDGKQVIFHATFRNGIAYGKITGILEPGKIKFIVNTDENGKFDGLSQYWNEKGQLIYIRDFVHGEKKPFSPEQTQCLSKAEVNPNFPTDLGSMGMWASHYAEDKDEIAITKCLTTVYTAAEIEQANKAEQVKAEQAKAEQANKAEQAKEQYDRAYRCAKAALEIKTNVNFERSQALGSCSNYNSPTRDLEMKAINDAVNDSKNKTPSTQPSTATAPKEVTSPTSSTAPDPSNCPGAEVKGTPTNESILVAGNAIEKCGSKPLQQQSQTAKTEPATVPKSSEAQTASLCGFINETPNGRIFLYDAIGDWQVDEDNNQVSNALTDQTACGCITGEVDKKESTISKIKSVSIKSMAVCKGDKPLMTKHPEFK